MNYREDFPILDTEMNGRRLVYLDNAATLQMPLPVLESVNELYRAHNGNVHRSGHRLGRTTSEKMERARESVRRFINAAREEEIIFTSGTTGGINMLAQVYAQQLLSPGDEVITTALEHHSNLLPWASACERSGAVLKIVPMTDAGELDMAAYRAMLSDKTRLVAACMVSNAIGTMNPVEEITCEAHKTGARVLLDAAQGMLHEIVDVRALDCDYLAFSGHKLGSLTGIGALYVKGELSESMEPVRFGGGMVRSVRGMRAELSSIPLRFEAGTPNYAGAISLGAAIEYIEEKGREALIERADRLMEAAEAELRRRDIKILGSPAKRAGAISFTAQGAHHFDIAQLLDLHGVAVRAGHHCAQNAVNRLGAEGSVRVSPAFYNTEEEIELFGQALDATLKMLQNTEKGR